MVPFRLYAHQTFRRRHSDISNVEHSASSQLSTCPSGAHTAPQLQGSWHCGARSASVSAAASAAHHSAVACCQAQRAECSARELSARAAADSAVPQRVEGTQGCAGRRCSSQRVCPWGSRRAMAAACCHELYARRARRARAARNCEQPLHRVAQDQGGHRREVSLTSRHRGGVDSSKPHFSIGAVLISIASGAAGLRGHRLRPMRKSQASLARALRTSRRREPRPRRAIMSSGAVPAARRERARSSVTRARALVSMACETMLGAWGPSVAQMQHENHEKNGQKFRCA